MDYELNRVVRPPNKLTECLLVEGTIQLADYDADLNIVFPGGQRAVLQWRVETPTLDLCFDRPVEVFNEAEDMAPAPANQSRPEHHLGVVQLVIPLPPEYAAELPYSVGLANESGSLMRRFATHQEASEFIGTLPGHEDGAYYLDGPEKEAKNEQN